MTLIEMAKIRFRFQLLKNRRIALLASEEMFFVRDGLIVDGYGTMIYEDIGDWTLRQAQLIAELHTLLTQVDFEHAWAVAEAYEIANGDFHAPDVQRTYKAACDFHCAQFAR